jgi:hypothetical protein
MKANIGPKKSCANHHNGLVKDQQKQCLRLILRANPPTNGEKLVGLTTAHLACYADPTNR